MKNLEYIGIICLTSALLEWYYNGTIQTKLGLVLNGIALVCLVPVMIVEFKNIKKKGE